MARSEDREATGIGILFDLLAIRQRLPYFVDQSEEVDRFRGVDLDHGPSACYRLESLRTPQFGGVAVFGNVPGRSASRRVSRFQGRSITAAEDLHDGSWKAGHGVTSLVVAPHRLQDGTLPYLGCDCQQDHDGRPPDMAGGIDISYGQCGPEGGLDGVFRATMGQPNSSARPWAIVVLPLAGGPDTDQVASLDPTRGHRHDPRSLASCAPDLHPAADPKRRFTVDLARGRRRSRAAAPRPRAIGDRPAPETRRHTGYEVSHAESALNAGLRPAEEDHHGGWPQLSWVMSAAVRSTAAFARSPDDSSVPRTGRRCRRKPVDARTPRARRPLRATG